MPSGQSGAFINSTLKRASKNIMAKIETLPVRIRDMNWPIKIEILERYFELWLEGIGSCEIQEIVLREFADGENKISESKFKDNLTAFFMYSRERVSWEYRNKVDGVRPAIPVLTAARRAQILLFAAAGYDYPKIAKLLNVPTITLTDFWFKEDPFLKVEVDTAIEIKDAKVIASLTRRALGHKKKSKTTTTVVGPEGTITTTSETEDEIAGDVNAQKFYLINRKPDQFSLDGEVNRVGNKGKILDFIENTVNDMDAF